jgi:hypothetical protein
LSGGHTFNCALYTNSATLDATTVAYTTSGEVATAGGYTAKGNTLTRIDPTSSSTTAYTDFADTTWATSTITARGGLIFNDSATTPVADCSVIVIDFLSDKVSSSGDFTIQFPAAAAATAIIRIA